MNGEDDVLKWTTLIKADREKKTLGKDVENDLIAENQRLKERLEYLEMENEYLKKLDALIRAEEQKKKQ